MEVEIQIDLVKIITIFSSSHSTLKAVNSSSVVSENGLGLYKLLKQGGQSKENNIRLGILLQEREKD